MERPLYDVIIGNVPGVQETVIVAEVHACDELKEVEETQAVLTRAQAQKEHKVKLLKVTESTRAKTGNQTAHRNPVRKPTVSVESYHARNDGNGQSEETEPKSYVYCKTHRRAFANIVVLLTQDMCVMLC